MELQCISALLLFLALCVMMPFELFISVFLSAAVHELGHLAALWAFGAKTEKVSPSFCGITITFYGTRSYLQDALCAFIGPAAGIVFSLKSALFAKIYGHDVFYTMCGASMSLSLFNLLPAMPLDGGRILFSLLAWKKGIQSAQRALYVSTAASSVFLILMGVFALTVSSSGITFILVGAWLCANGCKNF